jgi:hypothetical protein
MNDVEKYRNDLQVLKETAQQVQKDFSSCGLDFNLTGEEINAYELLLTNVHEKVEIAAGRHGALQQLLYRVDIPEKNFVMLKDTSEDFFHDLSKLILEREFMKVITRKFYDNKL